MCRAIKDDTIFVATKTMADFTDPGSAALLLYVPIEEERGPMERLQIFSWRHSKKTLESRIDVRSYVFSRLKNASRIQAY